MALANDLKALATLKSAGGYGGKLAYSFKTESDANTYYVLAYNIASAGRIATAIALAETETISTAVALLPVYVQTGLSV